MRSLILLVLFAGCSLSGYQWSPYVELQRRDEQFKPAGGADHYEGWTLMGGARLIPDTRYHPDTLLALSAMLPAHPAPAPAPTVIPVIVPPSAPTIIEAEPEPGSAEKLADKMIDESGGLVKYATWPGVAMLGVITVILFLIFRRFAKKGS